MRRIGHVITLAAMGATAAALASWVPVWWIGVLVALVIDGAWWTAGRYEARIRDTGADASLVTRLTWGIAGLSAVLLVVHAVAEWSVAWGAVAVLPLVSRTLAWIDSLWGASEVTPDALRTIREARQSARDEAAIARARLVAQAAAEAVRVETVTAAGARVARAQAAAAADLAGAWAELSAARQSESVAPALTCVTAGVTGASHPGVAPRWELPVWGEVSPLPAIPAGPTEPVMTDAELDAIVRLLWLSETPPLTYRQMSAAFRAAGHSAGEVRLRASWRRVTAESNTAS